MYLVLVLVLFMMLFFLAFTVGGSFVEGNCPAGVVDCGGAYVRNPLLWFPMKLVGTGGYAIPVGEGHSVAQLKTVFLYSVIYWLVISNVVALAIMFLLEKLRK